MLKKIVIVTFIVITVTQAAFIRDNDKELVKDTEHCLMWQDNRAAKTVKKTWQDAIDYCENLEFSGYHDWRLPNFNELYSISDKSRVNPAIDKNFQNVASSDYWTSTTVEGVKKYAWRVHFNIAARRQTNKDKSAVFYVRCVRDMQVPQKGQ